MTLPIMSSNISPLLPSGLEPEWLDNVENNGELFYLELSDDEEELALARAHGNYGMSTNHVHFSDKEAEIITEADGKQRSNLQANAEPKLKRLARLLRRKRHFQRRGGVKTGFKDAGSLPASILKNQAAQRQGMTEVKEVCVYVNPKRLTPLPNGGGGLLASLLGLVHCPYSGRGPGNPLVGGEGEALTIHGLVPNSPAIRAGLILIGDVLVAVNDVEVTTESIERVLSCIPGPTQVRLTLETSTPVEGLMGAGGTEQPHSMSAPPPRPRPKSSPPVSQLVRLLWGEDTAELQMSIGHMPHVVMYLSLKLDSESLQEEQEILYQYPVTDASGQLKGVRGVFLTLCDMLENVTGRHIISSSLLMGRHLVHVGYWKEGSKLLVLGLPAERVPLLYLQTVLGSMVRTLHVMYGSLDSAFCPSDHAPRLDHFFCLFFQLLIQPSRMTEGYTSTGPCPAPPTTHASACLFLDRLPAVRWLSLPPEIKGYLIANNLPREDLLDVCLYCQHYCLLPLASEQCVGQLVVWREVFPLHRSQQRAPCHSSSSSFAPDPAHYGPPCHTRHFLLIVGLRHLMQCVLMETGGTASPALGSPGPNCIYVKATLLQLEALHGGMEERLGVPTTLSCADWFLPAASHRHRLDHVVASATSSSSSVVLSKLFGDRARRPSPKRSLSDSGNDGPQQGAVGSGPHTTTLDARRLEPCRDSLWSGGRNGSSGSLFKMPRIKTPNPFYLGTLKKTLGEWEMEDMFKSIKLMPGVENMLFHYVLMETVQGIFIAPTHQQVTQLGGSIHPQLIHNFHHCCLSIRAAFQQSLPLWGAQGGAEKTHRPWGLGHVKEHGVLFQCKLQNWRDQKTPTPTMTYWVIGRMLLEPIPQEFYVCFHDSVPEIPVELAFRLSFGLAP
ncbi:hypothetical protein CRUP_024862 [Coryphaenoides rupestris]|nr:hypothetical protein CRUP_024862 [Coryphaenoides rupestris]